MLWEGRYYPKKKYRSLKKLIFNNHSLKSRAIVAVIILKPQFTKIEKNNCFSIHTRRNLNKIREETIKKYYVIEGSNHANF